MKSSLLAIRSIGADYANRLYYPILIIFIIAASTIVGLVLWLTDMNNWWLLLAVPTIMAICVGVAILVVVKLVIRYVTPSRTSEQLAMSKQIAEKLFNVTETAQTPKYILLFRIVRDIAAPRESGFIGELSNDTISLRADFKKLRDSFAQH